MSVETHRVLLGTCGWKHQAWLNDFYSEDLPEEWQLGFYANEFPVVYVPAADWLHDADIEEWTEDVSDSFRFILEIPENVLNDEERFVSAINKAKTLGEFCLSLVFQLSHDLRNDIQLVQKRLEVAQAIAPVCIDNCGTPFTTEFKQFLQKQNTSEVWDGKEENKDLTNAPLSICRVSGDTLDMASLRKVVEVCLAASSDNCISVLCLDGEPPSLEKLRNADIILNLI